MTMWVWTADKTLTMGVAMETIATIKCLDREITITTIAITLLRIFNSNEMRKLFSDLTIINMIL